MFDSIFTSAVDSTISLTGLLYALGSAIGLGLLVSLVYLQTHRGKIASQSFCLTLVFLPAVITVIILLVGSNVARAFSLAGAFSIIRFRSAPGDPKEISYVLFSMAIGLSCGMGYLLYALIVAVLLCALMAALELLHFGSPGVSQRLLKITIPENLDYKDAFDDILKQYTKSYQLTKLKTADLGSLYELQYRIVSRDDSNEKDFIDALRCRNGNLNISLLLDAPQQEFAQS